MSVDQLEHILLELLNAVATQPSTRCPTVYEDKIAKPPICISVPRDLIESGASQVARLALNDQVARQYFEARFELLKQGKNGDFEHLAHREIERALQRLVVEAWLDSESGPLPDQLIKVNEFLARYRRPHESWEVYWVIDDLNASEVFTASGVDFLPFHSAMPQLLAQYESPLRPAFEEKLIGSTLARTSVRAGSRERALDRAKVAIDNALNILRVASLSHLLLHDEQRLQRRGFYYLIRCATNSDKLSGGGQRGFRPIALDIGGGTLELLRERMSELDTAIGSTQVPRIREPLLRALHWIGSSISQESMDDKVVALCIALESLLCSGDRGAKAAPMTVRYLLAGYAIGESEYVVHPLDFYEIYGLRNDIVHGTAHAVCGKNDAKDLRYVALDSLNRISKLVELRPEITSLQSHYEHLKTKPSLSEVHDFLVREAPEGNHPASKLAEKWLKQAR